MKHFLSLSVLIAVLCAATSADAAVPGRRAIRQPGEIPALQSETKHLAASLPRGRVISAPIMSADGERRNYVTSSYWASAAQDISRFSYDIGIMASVIAKEGDPTVYLQALIPAWQEGLLKGTESDNAITFESGQLVSQWGVGNIYIGGATYNPRSEEYIMIDSFTFGKSPEDGSLTLRDTESGQKVYIVTYLENGALMEVEYDVMLDPFDEVQPEPAADAKYSTVIVTHFDDISKFPYKNVARMAVKGSEVWLEGLSGAPEGFVKGELLADGSIRIPTGQLTAAAPGAYITHMYTASKSEEDSQIYFTGNLTLTKAGETYSSLRSDYIRYGYDESTIEYQRKHFIIEPYDMTLRKPAIPVINGVSELGDEDYVPGHFAGDMFMTFIVPSECVDGKLLDTRCMSWRLFVNGELYTFTPSLYPSLEAATTEIPYSFSDFADIIYLAEHTLYLKMKDVRKVGIQSIYAGENGTIESDIAEYVVKDGLSDNIKDSSPINTQWHDLYGRRVESPADGIFVRTDIYPDGTKTSTLIRK